MEEKIHFELPEGRLASLREFAAHYFMIVLSILTALGLEEAGQYVHHRHAAEQAATELDAELRNNEHELAAAIAKNGEKLKHLQALEDQLATAIQAGEADAQIVHELVEPNTDPLSPGVIDPVLRSQAWEVAVANQSVAYLPTARQHDYAYIYAAQRQVASLVMTYMQDFTSGTEWVEVPLGMKRGNPQPAQVLRYVYRLRSAIAHTQDNLMELRQGYAEFFKPQPAPKA